MNILVNCGYDHGTVGAQHRMRNPTILCHLRKQKLEVVVVDEVRVKNLPVRSNGAQIFLPALERKQ